MNMCYITGLNLNLSAVINVDPVPMTVGLYAISSGDIIQDSEFSITLDLRDRTTDLPLEDITWRVCALIIK